MVCLARVLLLLCGKRSLMALGATSVEVSMKNISSRNTRSDMDAMLKVTFLLFRVSIAIFNTFKIQIPNFNTQIKSKSQNTNPAHIALIFSGVRVLFIVIYLEFVTCDLFHHSCIQSFTHSTITKKLVHSIRP